MSDKTPILGHCSRDIMVDRYRVASTDAGGGAVAGISLQLPGRPTGYRLGPNRKEDGDEIRE